MLIEYPLHDRDWHDLLNDPMSDVLRLTNLSVFYMIS